MSLACGFAVRHGTGGPGGGCGSGRGTRGRRRLLLSALRRGTAATTGRSSGGVEDSVRLVHVSETLCVHMDIYERSNILWKK